MGTEPFRPPTYSTPVLENNNTFQRPWYNLLALLCRRLLTVSQIGTISTSDIGVASATGVTAAATVTSADGTAPGAAYNQVVAATTTTLANEIKADLNTNAAKLDALVAKVDALITIQNLDAALLNEVKADLNLISSALNN